MAKINLTTRKLDSLRPEAKRYDIADSDTRGLIVRVSERGVKTFCLLARFPGSSNPTRRALGQYPTLGLADARETARDWLKLIGQGIDPQAQIERQQAAEARKRATTFGAVVADFIAEKLPSERSRADIERQIAGEFMPVWENRPIAEITDLDVLAVIKAKRRTAPTQARNLLALAKRFFAWAKDQRCYGLAVSPAADLKPRRIIGEKVQRDRILNEAEIFALWRAAGRIGHARGSVYRVLALTALRLNEAADAQWSEFDLPNRLWTIPASRMKGKNATARAHVVPITAELVAILATMERGKHGDFVFSTTGGARPIWIGDKTKKQIDARMLRTLQALARRRGDDPAKAALAPWRNHDIRRTVRSGLSRLKIAEEAREAVMAHTRPGIKGVYDLHDYLDEKVEALESWAARLRSIVEPAPANVVAIKRAG